MSTAAEWIRFQLDGSIKAYQSNLTHTILQFALASESFQSICLIGGQAIFLRTHAAVCNLWLTGRLRRQRLSLSCSLRFGKSYNMHD